MSPRSARTTAVIIFFTALAAAAIYTFRFSLRDNLFPRNFGVVDEHVLYRAGRLTPAATDEIVRRNGIKTIIDLGAYQGIPLDERLAQRTADALGVKRHVFTLEGDGTGHPMGYVEALRIIRDPANQPVLVHCAAGAQRTSVCVMLYEHVEHGVSLDAAYEQALDHKHDPARNPQMLPYVRRWADAIESAVKSGGTIDAPEYRAYRPLPAGAPLEPPVALPR
ncbi:hypothetical protein BH11PLA1_BH11PLA1_21780 [soil metagenome]